MATHAEMVTGTSSAKIATPANVSNLVFAATFNCDSSPALVTGNAGAAGWTIAEDSTGIYTVTHGLGLATSAKLIVVATAVDDPAITVTITNRSTNSFKLKLTDSAGTATIADVNIIAFLNE